MIFDIIVLVVLLASALFSFFRGFIREVLTILGVLGGTVAAIYLGPFLSPFVQEWIGADTAGEDVNRLFGVIPYPILADILSYGVVFLIFVIALSVISHILANWAKSIGLGPADRVLGVVFGAARGALILALLYLPVYLLIEQDVRDEWEWAKDSYSRPYVERSAAWVYSIIPKTEELDIEKRKSEIVDIADEVRKKMQERNVIPEEKNMTDSRSNTGYDEEEREGMDSLFGKAMKE